jgi:membrane associated rhomboid family serine protease
MTILYVIIAVTVLFSMQGFNNRILFEKYLFQPESILRFKEWYRMISSGILHVNWMHLGFNMYALYTFSEMLLFQYFTQMEFLALYVISMVAGNALALFLHRHHGDYKAVGASGAVSGVIYASIVLVPDGGIGIILIPGSIPSWIFGLLFIAYSIFGIRSQRDNIGHEAHLGGAIAGLVLTVLYFNSSVDLNYWIIAALLIPTLIFLYVIVYHPEWILTGKINSNFKPIIPKKRKAGEAELSDDRQRELNRLLDKVNRLGLEGLSLGERRRLDELSKHSK